MKGYPRSRPAHRNLPRVRAPLRTLPRAALQRELSRTSTLSGKLNCVIPTTLMEAAKQRSNITKPVGAGAYRLAALQALNPEIDHVRKFNVSTGVRAAINRSCSTDAEDQRVTKIDRCLVTSQRHV